MSAETNFDWPPRLTPRFEVNFNHGNMIGAHCSIHDAAPVSTKVLSLRPDCRPPNLYFGQARSQRPGHGFGRLPTAEKEITVAGGMRELKVPSKLIQTLRSLIDMPRFTGSAAERGRHIQRHNGSLTRHPHLSKQLRRLQVPHPRLTMSDYSVG